jgi:hypothetical protein
VQIAGNDLGFLHLLPKLEILSLEKSNITDQGLSAIASQIRLKFLWLDDTQITDARRIISVGCIVYASCAFAIPW